MAGADDAGPQFNICKQCGPTLHFPGIGCGMCWARVCDEYNAGPPAFIKIGMLAGWRDRGLTADKIPDDPAEALEFMHLAWVDMESSYNDLQEGNELSLLATVQKAADRTPKPRRVMLYGVEGCGKSTFGACAPSPIFINIEDGLEDINADAFPHTTTLEGVLEQLRAVVEEKHEYQTLVIDSLDWLERAIWDRVCADEEVESIERIGYGKGYQFALKYWRWILAACDAIRARGMHVVLLAHCRISKFEDPRTEAYDRFGPALHKLASAIVQEWTDEVLFANYKVFVTKADGAKQAKGAGNGERVMYTTERPSHRAKNRLGLPDEMPLAWIEYAKHLKTPGAPSAEKKKGK